MATKQQKAADLTEAEKDALDLQMGITRLTNTGVVRTATKLVLGAPVAVSATRATAPAKRPAALPKPRARAAERAAGTMTEAECLALDVQMGLVENTGVIRTATKLVLGAPVRKKGAK